MGRSIGLRTGSIVLGLFRIWAKELDCKTVLGLGLVWIKARFGGGQWIRPDLDPNWIVITGPGIGHLDLAQQTKEQKQRQMHKQIRDKCWTNGY